MDVTLRVDILAFTAGEQKLSCFFTCCKLFSSHLERGESKQLQEHQEGKMDVLFDIVVVGAGMIGSATARHLVLNSKPNQRICLIGPLDNCTGTARGQHFDLARITRRMDLASPLWAKWASRSISRYRALEAESGIPFYDPCGMLWLCTEEQASRMHITPSDRHHVVAASPIRLEDEFPWASHVDVGHFAPPALFAERPGDSGGTVHPNNLVRAQIAVAAARGGSRFTHLPLVATSVKKVQNIAHVACDDTELSTGYRIECVGKNGAHAYAVRGLKVVVCCGAMSSLHQLLPSDTNRILDVELVPELALLVPVTPKIVEDKEGDVPSCPSVINTSGPLDTHFYCLPPRYYEEHRAWFAKLGASAHTNEVPDRFTSCEDAVKWSDGRMSSPALVSVFANLVRRLYGKKWDCPKDDEACRAMQCVFDRTPHGHPMIGLVDGCGWFVACGGNGKAAKSSDELGRLTAELVLTGSFEDIECCDVRWRTLSAAHDGKC